MVDEKKVVSVIEAARILGIGKNLAYEAIHRSEIPSIKVGARLLVPLAALNRMLDPVGDGTAANDSGC